jgi:hypothetical protein
VAQPHRPPTQTEALGRLRVARRIAPDRDGAKRLALRYGDQLVCVRHRLNGAGTIRYTTVELLVDQAPVLSMDARPVSLRLPPGDKSTRSLLLAEGARWDPAQKIWLVQRQVARKLGLMQHIVR